MKSAKCLSVFLIVILCACHKKDDVSCGKWVQDPPDCKTEIRAKYYGDYKGELTWGSQKYDTTISITAGTRYSEVKWDQTIFKLYSPGSGEFLVIHGPNGGQVHTSGYSGAFSEGNKLHFSFVLKDTNNTNHLIVFNGVR